MIVGNPPWSAGQKSAADDNPNVDYPELEKRVGETYAKRSTSTNKNSLYDTYKMAVRWASDRIGDQGVVAFVTNGSWIDGNVDSGVRACLAEEFSGVYVMNLRGNARTSGQRRRAEGDNAFGQGSRAPVAITILSRNPKPTHEGCRILYRDIGDYLKREEKLAILREAGSIAGIDDWQDIAPDEHHDWIAQRDAAFAALYPLGSKAAKKGKSNEAIFRLFSQGYQTVGDVYLYNYSRDHCESNARAMVDDYRNAVQVREAHPDWGVDEAARQHSANIRWNRTLKNNLRRSKQISYRSAAIQRAAYRPFAKQFLYADPALSHLPGILKSMFPPLHGEVGTNLAGGGGRYLPVRDRIDQAVLRAYGRHDARSRTCVQKSVFPALPLRAQNHIICVPGIGANKPFSVLIADRVPDLHLLEFGQCYPRWAYPAPRG